MFLSNTKHNGKRPFSVYKIVSMKCLCSKFLFLFFMSNRPFFDEERWTKPFFHWIKGNEKKTLRRFKKTIVIAEGPKEWNRLFSASCYDELLLIIHFNPDNPTSVLHLTPKLIILVYRIFSTMPDRCNVHVFSSYAWDIHVV